jgi:hypothetical protein
LDGPEYPSENVSNLYQFSLPEGFSLVDDDLEGALSNFQLSTEKKAFEKFPDDEKTISYLLRGKRYVFS